MTYLYKEIKYKYTFDLSEKKEIKAFLNENGWVVVSDIASNKESSDIIDLQWKFIEGLGTGIDPSNPRTWYEPYRWPTNLSSGQVLAPGVGHCEAVWKARQIPKVKELFALLYGDDKLNVSFDIFNVTRPYTLASNRTKPLSPHIDQSPKSSPGLECYQGLLNLRPMGTDDGGTMLYSGSHLNFKKYTKYAKSKYDWVPITGNEDLKDCYQQMVSPNMKTGDMLIWDGRLVHGVSPPKKGFKDKKGSKYFRRSVVYVSMMPTSKVSDEVALRRKEYYEKGIATNHWVSKPVPKRIRSRYPRKIPYAVKEYVEVKLEDVTLL